jgi:glyoxalase family protein
MARVLGLHHVTAIVGDPQRNIDFYAGMLGLRLVKRTINFDDPETYHFYFGDEAGTPGSLITFFPWPGAQRAHQGSGQVAVTSFAIVPRAIAFWVERLLRYNIGYQGPVKRESGSGVEQVLSFKDHDGLMLEIVGHPGAESRRGWAGAKGLGADDAIRGVHGVTVWVEKSEPTGHTLVETLGFRELREDDNTRRYEAGAGGSGTFVDVREVGGFGRGGEGVGTVHHVAFAVEDDAAQAAMRERVARAGLIVTPVRDRNYFRSIYFREPGHVLYELATTGPGFAIDEAPDQLGESLRLPSQYEPRRAELMLTLPPIHYP